MIAEPSLDARRIALLAAAAASAKDQSSCEGFIIEHRTLRELDEAAASLVVDVAPMECTAEWKQGEAHISLSPSNGAAEARRLLLSESLQEELLPAVQSVPYRHLRVCISWRTFRIASDYAALMEWTQRFAPPLELSIGTRAAHVAEGGNEVVLELSRSEPLVAKS